jgi:hypothetical protein
VQAQAGRAALKSSTVHSPRLFLHPPIPALFFFLPFLNLIFTRGMLQHPRFEAQFSQAGEPNETRTTWTLLRSPAPAHRRPTVESSQPKLRYRPANFFPNPPYLHSRTLPVLPAPFFLSAPGWMLAVAARTLPRSVVNQPPADLATSAQYRGLHLHPPKPATPCGMRCREFWWRYFTVSYRSGDHPQMSQNPPRQQSPPCPRHRP